jgi:thiol-disulfide isomerase/thioredoxin
MINRWQWLGVFLLLIAAGSIYYKYRVAPEIDFTQLQLTDLYGRDVTLQYYAGEKTFVGFFATWCGPCRNEIHKLEMAKKELKQKSVEFVLISDESIEHLQQFDLRWTIRVTILHSKKPLKQLGIYTIPANYVLDKQLKVKQKVIDGSGEKLDELLNSFY